MVPPARQCTPEGVLGDTGALSGRRPSWAPPPTDREMTFTCNLATGFAGFGSIPTVFGGVCVRA